jgi:hypothetical protein
MGGAGHELLVVGKAITVAHGQCEGKVAANAYFAVHQDLTAH